MNTFKDRVVALTGASSGIGYALALDLARRGAHLALSDIDEVGLARVQGECEAHGVRVLCSKVDVAQRDAIYDWAEEVVAHFGVVHGLINNAGIAVHGSIEELPDEVYERVMRINFWGVLHGTRAFLPHLKRAPDAHIVNISSVFGLVGIPGQGAYNASKFAVRGFSEALIQELSLLSPHVHCTCVHPGGIKTNIAKSSSFVGQELGSMDPDLFTRRFDKMARTTPARASELILKAVLADKHRVLVGEDAIGLDLMQRLIPNYYHAITARPYAKLLAKDRQRSK